MCSRESRTPHALCTDLPLFGLFVLHPEVSYPVIQSFQRARIHPKGLSLKYRGVRDNTGGVKEFTLCPAGFIGASEGENRIEMKGKEATSARHCAVLRPEERKTRVRRGTERQKEEIIKSRGESKRDTEPLACHSCGSCSTRTLF